MLSHVSSSRFAHCCCWLCCLFQQTRAHFRSLLLFPFNGSLATFERQQHECISLSVASETYWPSDAGKYFNKFNCVQMDFGSIVSMAATLATPSTTSPMMSIGLLLRNVCSLGRPIFLWHVFFVRSFYRSVVHCCQSSRFQNRSSETYNRFSSLCTNFVCQVRSAKRTRVTERKIATTKHVDSTSTNNSFNPFKID